MIIGAPLKMSLIMDGCVRIVTWHRVRAGVVPVAVE
jgi:hypothetical protein